MATVTFTSLLLVAASLPVIFTLVEASPSVVNLFGADSPTDGWRGPSIINTKRSLLVFASGPAPGTTGPPGVGVAGLRRSTDLGQTWSQLEILPMLGHQPQLQSWVQVVYDPATDTIFGFGHYSPAQSGSCARACGRYVTRSTDDGRNWTAPVPVSDLVNTSWGNGLAHGVKLRSGRLVVAFRTDCADVTSEPPQFPSNCTINPDGSKGGDNPITGHINPTVNRLLVSDDHGDTWQPGGPTPGAGDTPYDKGNLGWTECQVAELANGSLVLTSRVMNTLGSTPNVLPFQRMFTMSDDGGDSWGEAWAFAGNQAYGTGFGPGFNTQGSLISAQHGQKLLLSKPTAEWCHAVKGCNHNVYRRNLTVAASSDGGASWSIEPWGLVYPELAAYSDMIELEDGTIGVAFERGGKKDEYRFVSFAVVRPPWLKTAMLRQDKSAPGLTFAYV